MLISGCELRKLINQLLLIVISLTCLFCGQTNRQATGINVTS